MKTPDFLDHIHIGEIIRKEIKQHHPTKKYTEMIAGKINRTERSVRNIFNQKSIKINRLIEISYALRVNLLQVYLRKMPLFGNSKMYDDEVIIGIADGRLCITPSPKSKTTDFLQSIHIGNILQMEADKQYKKANILANIFCCEQSAISRMYGNPDIDTERLIHLSYLLNYDFLRNIYLPYMCVDETEITVNDCISNPCTIKVSPKTVSIISNNWTVNYCKIEPPE